MVNVMDEEDRKKTKSVALLVAKEFLTRPRNSMYNTLIYLDGDKTNCAASNLMWRPRWYAVRYHKMFGETPINVSVIIQETGETFATLRDLCVKYGLDEKYTYVDMLNDNECFHYNFRIKRYSAS